MPTEPPPLTLSEVVHRAVEVVEVGDTDDRVRDFLTRFEDDDEPIAGIRDSVEGRVEEVHRSLDIDADDPPLAMACAVTVYLAFRRDAFDVDPYELLRLAARAEYDARPPVRVAQWLEEAGVKL